MTTDERPTDLPANIDPDASPYKPHGIEGLPMTKEQREELRRVIEEFDRERATAEGTR